MGDRRTRREYYLIGQSIQGKFRLQTLGDGEMDGGDLIFAARDAIASAVANSAVSALEQRFEGKRTGKSNIKIDREDGEKTGYRRTDMPKEAGGDQSAPTSSRLH